MTLKLSLDYAYTMSHVRPAAGQLVTPSPRGNDGQTYEGWGYFFEEGYETSQALQARLATFLRGTAGWTVAVEQW